MKKISFKVGCTILLSFCYSPVIHACSPNGNNAIVNTFDFGTVTVDRDVPVGTVIGRVIVHSINRDLGRCTTNPWFYIFEMFLPPSPLKGVYSTNVRGIGIRTAYYSNPALWVEMNNAPVNINEGARQQQFELIKTGNITPGRISLARIARLTIQSSAGMFTAQQFIVENAVIQTRSCKVLNSLININLGTAHRREEFAGIGSTANSHLFSIPLNCDENTPVSITINNVTPLADEANGVLAVNPDSTAQGVGVQMRHNNKPVHFGKLINYKNSVGGSINIPFEARLYQISEKVLPGTIKATATFIMTYK